MVPGWGRVLALLCSAPLGGTGAPDLLFSLQPSSVHLHHLLPAPESPDLSLIYIPVVTAPV